MRGRYVVCLNGDQATKDRHDRDAVVASPRDVLGQGDKSLVDTRPIFHRCDETIRGHVFCSFLALLLRKELEGRLWRKEWKLEWAEVFQACTVALPPVLRLS